MTPFESAARALIASKLSAGTRRLYIADLVAWLWHCKLDEVDPSNPTLEAAIAFRDSLKNQDDGKPLAPLTQRRILSALSKMYKRAVGRRAAVWNPFDSESLDRPPSDKFATTEAVSDDALQLIIGAAEADKTPAGRRDTALLHLLSATGMRREEVAGIRRENVMERGGRIVVSFYGKGRKRRETTLPETTEAALNVWMNECTSSAFVFPQLGGKKPIDPSTVNRVVTKRMTEAGITGVHPHQFRAAFATHALDYLPLQDVQDAMGHADPNTTRRYDQKRRGAGVADRVAEARNKK